MVDAKGNKHWLVSLHGPPPYIAGADRLRQTGSLGFGTLGTCNIPETAGRTDLGAWRPHGDRCSANLTYICTTPRKKIVSYLRYQKLSPHFLPRPHSPAALHRPFVSGRRTLRFPVLTVSYAHSDSIAESRSLKSCSSVARETYAQDPAAQALAYHINLGIRPAEPVLCKT